MNKKEQELLNQIGEKSEAVNVPKSLEPGEMEELLKKRPKKFVWKKAYIAAAACCLLVCGLAYGMMKEPDYVSYVEREDNAGVVGEGGVSSDSGLATAQDYEEVY